MFQRCCGKQNKVEEDRTTSLKSESNRTPKKCVIKKTGQAILIENETKKTSSEHYRKISSDHVTIPFSSLVTSQLSSFISTEVPNEQHKNDSDSDIANNNSITQRRSGLAAHATNTEKSEIGTINIKKYDKTKRSEELIEYAISQNAFLQSLFERERLQAVIDAMYLRAVKKNEVIICEDYVGTQLYISAGGSYEVTIKGERVYTFKDYRVFGELAILYNAKRQATITALTDGLVWVLDQKVFQLLMLVSEIEQQDELVTFLRTVPKLNTVSIGVLRQVSNLLQREFFAAGTCIVRQGDTGEKFYIISAGTVIVSKEDEVERRELGRGKYFGELALLNDSLRQATVIAKAPGVECFSLSRQQFIDHFGNVEDIGLIPDNKRKSTAPLLKPYEDVQLNDLKRICLLGVGGFGRVDFMQHREHATLTFALKYIPKVLIVQQQQQEHVFNEKNIQIRCNSEFIVRLYKTYRDEKYIYFLMEPCLGGDLWLLMQTKGRRFEESAVRFYAASVVEALAYLHERSIVYRDLKSENLVLDTQGYVKLTDFSFAKKLDSRGKTYTFACTPEYAAPEVILARGHNRAVDYWALGILIFELLVGRTPFCSPDSSYTKTFNLILRGIKNVEFPNMVSDIGENLIKRLCRSIATERLGCLKEGPQAIRRHRWFSEFDWEQLRSLKMKAPFKRNVKGDAYLKNLQKYDKNTDAPPDELSGWDIDF